MPGIMSEGSHIHAHNTLSAENTEVQVFYPFHPLHGATLQMVRRSKRGDGAVSVTDPTGKRLKIPVWMLLPDCTQIKVSLRNSVEHPPAGEWGCSIDFGVTQRCQTAQQ